MYHWTVTNRQIVKQTDTSRHQTAHYCIASHGYEAF